MTDDVIAKAEAEREAYIRATDPQYYNAESAPGDAIIEQARAVDAQHEMMQELIRERDALKRQLATAEPVSAKTSDKLNAAGGEPVPHHLHLVDGRVIPNHPGIGTHYSEVFTDNFGNQITKVTRVHAHYPANEVDPASLFV